jgi:hypothetical protein
MTSPANVPREAFWIPANENPLGVDLLDCRPLTQTMVAVSQSPEIAASYATLRESKGDQHRGQAPKDAARCLCD